ncbi:zinc finger protein 43-like [Bolinopsis microptera]|uniref:zinc finger protein 43-like n=1 Tax=Bolinopsis microptera TaxID=2820187 RepID=UPI00307A7E48
MSKDCKQEIKSEQVEKPEKFDTSDNLTEKDHQRTLVLSPSESPPVRPFKCSECSYATRRAGDLRKHMRIHSDEKPFKCSECSYAAKQASNLSRHLRTHSGEKPFKCSECSFAARHARFLAACLCSIRRAWRLLSLDLPLDPDNRIKWEIEFPSTPADFVPFLSTEIRIDEEGKVHHRFYRKTQNKGITLHQKSHHPDSVKEECKKNFYRNATIASSGPQELDHSSYFTPGKKLQDIFCRSRPLDKKTCDLGNPNNCEICPRLTGTTCSTKGAIYLVTCELCGKRYCGET